MLSSSPFFFAFLSRSQNEKKDLRDCISWGGLESRLTRQVNNGPQAFESIAAISSVLLFGTNIWVRHFLVKKFG